MRRSIAYCILFTSLACNTNIEVQTEGNYEAFVLPDGSQVYMNHHSSITYQEDFSPRTVNLTGEAFFTVKPNESIFTVLTTHGNIEVLGTEFNIKTTSDQVTVDVKKGIIEIKTKYEKSTVRKGTKAVYKQGDQVVQKIKSKKEYRKWILSLEKDFKAFGKQLKPALKQIGNDFNQAGKKIGEELKN